MALMFDLGGVVALFHIPWSDRAPDAPAYGAPRAQPTRAAIARVPL